MLGEANSLGIPAVLMEGRACSAELCRNLMYSLMLGKPFLRAAFSNSKRSSVVSLTLVISVRGAEVLERKVGLSQCVIQQAAELDGNCITD
jgi:hypothetical protein